MPARLIATRVPEFGSQRKFMKNGFKPLFENSFLLFKTERLKLPLG
jgi:hypothetical protein